MRACVFVCLCLRVCVCVCMVRMLFGNLCRQLNCIAGSDVRTLRPLVICARREEAKAPSKVSGKRPCWCVQPFARYLSVKQLYNIRVNAGGRYYYTHTIFPLVLSCATGAYLAAHLVTPGTNLTTTSCTNQVSRDPRQPASGRPRTPVATHGLAAADEVVPVGLLEMVVAPSAVLSSTSPTRPLRVLERDIDTAHRQYP